ncbi:MAG: MATE family efflux transporter [Lachnospiraceae bacterium]|nr:MATE family efflux transporter [Lachnospiraceae bacterium]
MVYHQRMKDMTTGKIMNSIIGFAVPMLISSIFQQLYSVMDTLIISRFLGPDALAGVGSTGQITFLTLCIALGMGNGGGLIISQSFGSKDMRKLERTIVSMSYIMVLLAACMSCIGYALSGTFLQLTKVPDNVFNYSLTYLQITFAFSGGVVLYNWASSILRSVGDSRTPLIALILSSFLNIGLDLLFILQFKTGIAGAAYATVISQFLSGFLCLIKVYQNGLLHGFRVRPLPDLQNIWLVVRTSIPSIFQSCMISLGGISVQRLINSFGSDVMAGYVAASKVDSLAIQVILSVGNALCVFTGQNIGKKDYDRIKEALFKSRLLMLASATLIAICAYVFRYAIISLFIDKQTHPAALAAGAEYLSIIGIAYLICAVMQSYQNVIRGAGDVNTCMVAGMTELAGKIVFAYLFAPLWGATAIWISTPFSWACGCIIPVVRYYSGKWKYKIL